MASTTKTPREKDGSAAWLDWTSRGRTKAGREWKPLLERVILDLPEDQCTILAPLFAKALKKMLGKTPAIQTRSDLAKGKPGTQSAGLRVSLLKSSDKAATPGQAPGFAPPSPTVPGQGSTPAWYDLAATIWTLGLSGAAGQSGAGLELQAASPAAAVWASLRLLMDIQTGKSPTETLGTRQAANPLRILNHWDNMDGSIERGYAGGSIFFKNYRFLKNRKRWEEYARLLASLGLNSLCINNVNVHQTESYLITDRFLPDLAELAAVFRPWGIRLFLSINYAAPITVGGLPVSDPLDSGVIRFWKERAEEIYRFIPDFGGFLVKADSEGRPGPFAYGRTHAEGANMLARALKPHGGLLIWRCFVYNCLQNWRDRSTDRARAAYEHFQPLDGKFDDNVILQIKNGPMDFQVREPVSPLLGGMKATNQILELQATQEYTGQQKHLCYLGTQWKDYLDFPTHAPKAPASVSSSEATLAEVASGQVFNRPLGGMAAVGNIGDDANWCGHHLAQANWFAFGRLAWDPSLSARDIAAEWTSLTFPSLPPKGHKTLVRLLMESWQVYESYTAPLGVGWMVNPSHHYGPNVDGYEYDRWGTYHFADCKGMGVDRTAATGTRYAAQYHSPWKERYESLPECPDEVLLFFHHVPYTHRLHSGKTVIQHIYDTHFAGADAAGTQVDTWKSLEGLVDERRWKEVLARLEDQARHSQEWRDLINTYFWRKSGIKDKKGRTIY